MISKILTSLSSTDVLPVIGGAGGAFTSQIYTLSMFPNWEVIVYMICITSIGAITGYIIKILLDKLFKRKE